MKNLFLATMVMTTLLALSWQTAMAQSYGGRHGTGSDTYIINNDHSNHKAVLRLQSGSSAGFVEKDNNRIRWRWANSINHGNYGISLMSLDEHGCLYVNRAVDGGNARMGALSATDQSANFYNKALSNLSGNIALKQDNNGTTHLNSANGRVLNFKQGNVTRMYLETNGNVRVNNSLTVNGNFLSNNHVSVASGNGKGFRFWNNDFYKIHMGSGSEYWYGPVTDYAIKMTMSSNANRGWVWGVSGQAPVAALSNAGNMELKGTLKVNGGSKLVVQNGQNGGAGRGLFMWKATDSNWGIYMGQAGSGRALDGGNAVAGYGFSSHTIRFRSYHSGGNGFVWENSNDQLLMSLRASDGLAYFAGNVDVKGRFRTREIEVLSTSTWPDYVFADDYALPTLASVESHIKANKHLPGVPSEAEVMEEGINLGEMDAVLLQKVEELTLYLIEQNKQLATQNERLAAQNQQLATQGQRIAELEQQLSDQED